MNVIVDREICGGIGNCVEVAPTVFALDEEDRAVVLDPSSVPEETLMEAAESCPLLAISVLDDNGNQLFP
ncbi:MAG: ferredoxin [Dehalococcoidia bacterium]|nr:ferredoxin [Dehalococcoidia bacterium]